MRQVTNPAAHTALTMCNNNILTLHAKHNANTAATTITVSFGLTE